MDVTRREQVLCPAYMAGRIMRAANVLGARVRLETHVGGVRAGWAYCEWQELTYKRSVISSLLTNLARVKYKVDSSINLKSTFNSFFGASACHK